MAAQHLARCARKQQQCQHYVVCIPRKHACSSSASITQRVHTHPRVSSSSASTTWCVHTPNPALTWARLHWGTHRHSQTSLSAAQDTCAVDGSAALLLDHKLAALHGVTPGSLELIDDLTACSTPTVFLNRGKVHLLDMLWQEHSVPS
jgi:hypothetical protein